MPRSFLVFVALLHLSFFTHAGPFREKLKERWIEKQKEKPAPIARTDTQTKIEKSGDYTFSLSSNGMSRYYMIHVPAGYEPKKPTPVIFVLHGGGGNMEIQATDEFYKQISKSDSAGYIAVFPNGSSAFASGKLATWNAGHCCGQARDNKVDDVQFFKDLINTLSQQLNIDKQRLYAIGMSNGGMMSYRLACEMAGTFKAIASVAGTDNTATCKPANAISILHIHAQDDDHVLYHGGAGKNAFKDLSQVTEFKSVPETMTKWTALNACTDKTPQRILQKAGAYCEVYSHCKDGTRVQLCVTEKGGHSWPGGKKPRALSGASPSTAISANDIIWDFFKSLSPQ